MIHKPSKLRTSEECSVYTLHIKSRYLSGDFFGLRVVDM